MARSKTDQAGTGLIKALPRGGNPRTCPQCALVRWMECVTIYDDLGLVGLIRLLCRDTPPDTHRCATLPAYPKPRSSLFRSLVRGEIHPVAMTGNTMHMVVRRRLAASFPDLEAVEYGAHSLRAGFVTESYLQGKSDREIMRQTGHRSVSSLHRYAREVSAFDNNAAVGLGL